MFQKQVHNYIFFVWHQFFHALYQQKVMDELFSEDAVFLPKSQSQTNATVAPPGEDSGRLQRAASLSLYPG